MSSVLSPLIAGSGLQGTGQPGQPCFTSMDLWMDKPEELGIGHYMAQHS